MSHSSTLRIVHTAMRAPRGSFQRGRPGIGTKSKRSLGSLTDTSCPMPARPWPGHAYSTITDRDGPRRQRHHVTAEFWVTQTFNGVSYGALLFLLAAGLSLIFGVMRIVNMTHGSYYLLGGYVGL